MLLTPEAIKHHIDNGHSAQLGTVGIIMLTEPTEKPDPLWQALEDAGMEIHDIRCDVCGKTVPLHHFTIANHCKPHAGETRRVRPGGAFRITLSLKAPEPDYDELQDEE
jgi:hypothetical protein